MNIVILKNNLKVGLDTVGRAIGSSFNLPILGNILIKATKEGIFLSATNLELAITKKVLGKVNEEGSITVPFSVLSNIVGNSVSERIHLEQKEKNLILKTDNYEATIQGIQENEFPIIPNVSEERAYFEMNAGVLKEKLQKVIVAAGISELRPEISGVFFIMEAAGCKLVATDSFRLAEISIMSTQFKNSFEQGMRVIVPLKTAQEMLKVFDDEENVRIYIEQNQILVKSADVSLISRLIEGKFPDYEAIIPKNVDVEIVVKRDDLMSALKLMNAFSGRMNEIKIKVKDERVIEFYASDNALGENTYTLLADVKGTPLSLVFNGRYLIDGIRAEASKDVYLGFNSENKPSIIRSPKSTEYFYIVMPIKQ